MCFFFIIFPSISFYTFPLRFNHNVIFRIKTTHIWASFNRWNTISNWATYRITRIECNRTQKIGNHNKEELESLLFDVPNYYAHKCLFSSFTSYFANNERNIDRIIYVLVFIYLITSNVSIDNYTRMRYFQSIHP